MTQRVLIVAPGGRDAKVIETVLARGGIESEVATADHLVEAVNGDAFGLAVIVDGALPQIDFDRLGQALSAQPPWADFPMLLLTSRGTTARSVGRVTDLLGNVTLLERPLHPDALFSAVRSALRARARQRAAASYLAARETAEEELRTFAAMLETRVEQRTAELAQVSTARLATLEQVRQSEELYRYTVELSLLIPWTADAAGQVETVGSRWVMLTGMTVAETLGDGWNDGLHPDDRVPVMAAWRRATADASELDIDYRIRFVDGSYHWQHVRAAPRRSADGSVQRYYGTIVDIEERKQANNRLQRVQAELIEVSRLSAMGAMASTLAHELNQPLTAIANYARGARNLMAQVEGGPVDQIRDALSLADESALRAGEIVRRLREMVTRGDVDRRPEDLATVIDEACRIALIDASTLGVAWHVEHAPDIDTVMIDRIQIQQVLLNLLRNAIEALGDTSGRRIVVSTTIHDKDFCEVGVWDNGPGLAPDIAAGLFSPFNSTKPASMGIGLSISRTIVEAHGGQIWADQDRGSGTSFHFTLPRSTL